MSGTPARADCELTLEAIPARGWRAVLLGEQRKTPVGETWQITDDVQRIEQHLAGGGNIGNLAGEETALAIFDDDQPALFRAMEAALGPLGRPWVVTGSGKYHRCVEWEPALPALLTWDGQRVGEIKRGGTRAEPRLEQAVMPPSLHPDGPPYEWLVDPRTEPLIVLPEAWRRYLKGRVPGQAPAFTVPEIIPQGARNDTLYRLARSLKTKGLSIGAVGAALEAENLNRCHPPLAGDELLAILESAWRRADDPTFAAARNGHNAGAPTTSATEVADAPATPYVFTPAFPPEHFVSRFLTYGTQCVDSAHDYLETVALVALAAATPGLRARLKQYPRGLCSAFYAVLIGDSTRSRKSTVAALGLDLIHDAVPDCQLAEQASPEAFVEQVALRSHDSTVWYCDELGETLDKLHHAKYMAGLRGLLLSLYDGRPHRYKRSTKRTKQGEAVADELVIEDPNLAVLGATTEAIFEIVTGRDVSSGFMARFAVVMPTSRPARMALSEATEDLTKQRDELAAWLTRIYLWAKTGPRRVRFTGDALAIVDGFAAQVETSSAISNERCRAMLQRLNAMTVKLAMLSAAGCPQADNGADLAITPDDARAAVAVATRWRDYAITFGERVGETAFEQLIDRATKVVKAKKRAPRRVVAKNVHCSKRTMDDIEATLVDRGVIVVEHVDGKSGPATTVWIWCPE
jgi:Protein of unknown function (DUF3987)/Bifunctional DNA primase/polymerase, N-terminal/Primase C terminal 1 (PriCT-1)